MEQHRCRWAGCELSPEARNFLRHSSLKKLPRTLFLPSIYFQKHSWCQSTFCYSSLVLCPSSVSLFPAVPHSSLEQWASCLNTPLGVLSLHFLMCPFAWNTPPLHAFPIPQHSPHQMKCSSPRSSFPWANMAGRHLGDYAHLNWRLTPAISKSWGWMWHCDILA